MNLHVPGRVVTLSLLLWAGISPAQTNSANFWRDQSIYQIITDRFFDGDPSNNNADWNFDPAGSRGASVHGGDFKGIEQKLDYIQALGATAIWISPIVLNVRGEFHGYAGRDFYKIDPHLFSPASVTFQNLETGRRYCFGNTHPRVVHESFATRKA